MDNDNSNRFLFNLEWVEILKVLPKEVKYEVYDAIIEYAASGITPDLKPMALGVFMFIKRELDYNKEQRLKKIEARKEAGSKGGKAKQTKQKVAKQANATIAKQTKQSQANSSIYEYDNDNVDIVDKSTISPMVEGVVAVEQAQDILFQEIQERKKSMIWKESIQMKFKISSNDVDRYLDEFYLDAKCRETNVEQVASYFTSWLNIKVNNGNANRTGYTRGESKLNSKLPPKPGHGLRER